MPAVLSPVRSGTPAPADPSGPSDPAARPPSAEPPVPPAPPEVPEGGRFADDGGMRGGMFWSWPLDFDALQAALNNPVSWRRGQGAGAVAGAAGARADAAAEEPPAGDAARTGEGIRLSDSLVAGRVVESLPPGPELAGWLALAEPGELEDGALAGVAASFRRLASWAQAGELAVVAQIAARAAARDPKIGVVADGWPVQMPRSACSEVALGLVLSEYGAAWWTDLGVTLRWRLAATGAAHAGGPDRLAAGPADRRAHRGPGR